MTQRGQLRYLLRNTKKAQQYLFANGYCWDTANKSTEVTEVSSLDEEFLVVFHPVFADRKPDGLHRVQFCDAKFYEFDKQNLIKISLKEFKSRDKPEPEYKSWFQRMKDLFTYADFSGKK